MTRRQIVDEVKTIISKEYNVNSVLKKLDCSFIASGQYRMVYEVGVNKRYVLKVETGDIFSNITEFQNWELMCSTCYAKWFAPCYFVTTDGVFLLQRKVQKVERSRLPKKIPPFFLDVHPRNWGMLNGRAVCVDYPILLPDQNRFKTARWRKH